MLATRRGFALAKFKTRARTVEMLGRQQIAGIPTAISELFKNAYDAYALSVEVDFYRPDSLFVLRDDGLGMTRNDFEERWLALGTESKLSEAGGLLKTAKWLKLKSRHVLGEKGIGRLAIAAVGPQVLVLTRAKRSSGPQDLVAAFINWSMFAIPGIDISEIEIPIKAFSGGSLPSQADISEMVAQVRSNLMGLQGDLKVQTPQLDSILSELNAFQVDPESLSGRLSEPTLQGDGHGTHFYVQPVSDNLILDIDTDDAEEASPLAKMLIGFSNTMVPDHEPPIIQAEFRDHKSPGIVDYLISEGNFFTPDDFLSVDHMIRGEFDEFGQFTGAVTVYGQESVQHIVPWAKSHGVKTECGPFRIDLAYAQGNQRDTQLSPEDFNRITRKLNLFGGLYIYRDGIRVLPYGDHAYDFLRIEERRTRSASYYFFSYRRLFGVLSISRAHNLNLMEKAGREGFQENGAYKQFKQILENFFVQTAASFFRIDTPQGDMFTQRRSEINRIEELTKERDRRVGLRRRTLQASLEQWFGKVASAEPDGKVAKLISALHRDLEALANESPQRMVDGALRAEEEAQRALAGIRDEYRVVQPRGVGLPRNLRRDVDAYRVEFARLETAVFRPTAINIAKEVDEFGSRLNVAIDLRRRFERSTKATAEGARGTIRKLAIGAHDELDKVSSRVKTTLNQSSRELEIALDKALADVQRTSLVDNIEPDFAKIKLSVDTQIETIAEEKQRLFEVIIAQLQSVTTSSEDSGELITPIDLAEAAEEELLALRESVDTNLELAQLGQAINVINHEFQASVNAIRGALRDLASWAEVNDRLSIVYDTIRTSFDHLDAYLELLTPLRRRSHQVETEIKGTDIEQFLHDLFDQRLDRHQVQLEATDAFKGFVMHEYPSTFYPVFINLIDNAVYWLSDKKGSREIWLDIEGDSLTISDTGPGVPARDRQAIFEAGFTRKPGGTGLGLHISRDLLHRVGYDLTLEPHGARGGATFRIERVAEPAE